MALGKTLRNVFKKLFKSLWQEKKQPLHEAPPKPVKQPNPFGLTDEQVKNFTPEHGINDAIKIGTSSNFLSRSLDPNVSFLNEEVLTDAQLEDPDSPNYYPKSQQLFDELEQGIDKSRDFDHAFDSWIKPKKKLKKKSKKKK